MRSATGKIGRAFFKWRAPLLRLRVLDAISESIAWSNLSSLGNAPLFRATILVPVLGYIIVFSEQFAAVFRLSETYLSVTEIESGAANDVTMWNIYFTYFGLSAFGVASLVYTLACPNEIKREPDRLRHAVAAGESQTAVVVKSSLQDVLRRFFWAHNHDCEVKGIRGFSYTSRLANDFLVLINELYESWRPDDNSDGTLGLEAIPETETDQGLYFGDGRLDVGRVAFLSFSEPRAAIYLSDGVRSQAPKHAQGIAFVKHRHLDLSGFAARCAVAILYLVGSLLVLWPTIQTFGRIVVSFA